jgi:hypothetical protein
MKSLRPGLAVWRDFYFIQLSGRSETRLIAMARPDNTEDQLTSI